MKWQMLCGVAIVVLSVIAIAFLQGRSREISQTQKVDQSSTSRPEHLYILGVGQSNMARYFLGNGEVAKFLEKRLLELDSSIISAKFLNSASGGSSVLRENVAPQNPTNYWLEQDAATHAFSPGPMLKSALEMVNAEKAQGRAINFILWAQGEQDAAMMIQRFEPEWTAREREASLQTQMANYRKGVEYIFASLREASGSGVVPIGIQVLGQRRTDENGNPIHIMYHHIRMLQYKMAQEVERCLIIGNAYDQSMSDIVHMDDPGRLNVLARIAGNIVRFREGKAPLLGPAVESVRQINERTLLVEFSGVRDLRVGADASSLFSLHSKDYEFTMRPVKVAKLSATTVELQFDSPMPVESRLLTTFGLLSNVDTSGLGYLLSSHGRFVEDEEKNPMQPADFRIGSNIN